MRTAGLIYIKKRSGVLGFRDMPPCNSVTFDVSGRSIVFGGRELSRGDVTDAHEDVPEIFITSSGFSALEDIAREQADARAVASYGDVEGDSMVQVPPADELLGQEGKSREKSSFYPS